MYAIQWQGFLTANWKAFCVEVDQLYSLSPDIRRLLRKTSLVVAYCKPRNFYQMQRPFSIMGTEILEDGGGTDLIIEGINAWYAAVRRNIVSKARAPESAKQC
jgi:hypothetical protein